MDLQLPFPPSVNHYWRRVGARTLISREGRAFRDAVGGLCYLAGARAMEGDLAIEIKAHPPDRRRRDLDNLLKATLDALQAGGCYGDDHQVAEIHLYREHCRPSGCLDVSLWPIGSPRLAQGSDLKAELTQRAMELQNELEAIREALAAMG